MKSRTIEKFRLEKYDLILFNEWVYDGRWNLSNVLIYYFGVISKDGQCFDGENTIHQRVIK